MTNNFEIKKIASALICTVLFSTTCVLSAVGPAQAVEHSRFATRVVASDASLVVGLRA